MEICVVCLQKFEIILMVDGKISCQSNVFTCKIFTTYPKPIYNATVVSVTTTYAKEINLFCVGLHFNILFKF